MVRKFQPHLLAITAVIFLLGCSREVDKPTRLSFTFPQATSKVMSSQSVSALSSKWGFSDPTSTSQINCYAILIEASDLQSGSNICKDLAGTMVASPRYIHGGFAAGTTQQITVTSGKRRKISLVGFYADVMSDCKMISATSGLNPSQISAPHILTSETLDLEPGDQNVALNVPASIPANSKFEDCAPMAFVPSSSGTPSTNLTLASVSPSFGMSSGGTSVVVTGTNFDAGTTVHIGGVPCTSPVILSTQITCTAGAHAPSTYDVVVTKGLETATLLSAFTYSAPHAMNIADANVGENSGGSVNIGLSGPSMGVTTVDYTLTPGTAGAGTDYTTVSGSLTISSGATGTSLVLNNMINDAVHEGNETFTVTLSNVSANAFISDGVGTITIVDDETAPSLSVANASVNENGTSVDVTITASGVSGNTMMFAYATSDGTASAPADYTSTSGPSGMITAGLTSTVVTVPISQDAIFEGSETFSFTISTPTNATIGTATATITITDDDVAPTLSVADTSIAEGGTNVLVQINASHAASVPINFDYATSNGTALSGLDYASASASSAVGAGATFIQVSIPIIQDSLDEDNETFNLVISNPSLGSIADNTGVVTITDDDAEPDVQFSLSTSSGSENSGTASLTAVLSAASGKTVSVNYSPTGGTATGGGTDFTLAAGTLTFAPGDTSEDVNIALNNDGSFEGSETVIVVLAGPTNATMGAQASHTYTILDDETPAVLTISEIDPWDFGNVAQGGVSERTFTLTNTGGATATGITGNGIAPPFSFKGGTWPGTGGTCGGSLAASSTCTFIVEYSPTAVGPHGDTINVDYNDGAGAQYVQRTLTGMGSAPAVLNITSHAEPGEMGDGLVSGSLKVLFTVTNQGGVPATAIGGTGLAAPFSFSGGSFPGTLGNCVGSIPPAGTCTFEVDFQPSTVGLQNDTVELGYHNGANASTNYYDIQATGFRRMVYAAAPTNDVVLIFEQQPDGSLTSLGTQAISSSPREIVASPNGKHLYVSRNSDSVVQSFTINSNGTLSSYSVTSSHAGTTSTMIFDRLARWLMYGMNIASYLQIYVQDYTAASGALSPASGSPFSLADRIGKPAFHPTQDILFLPDANDNMVRAYTVSGIGTPSFDSGTQTTPPVATANGTNVVAVKNNWVYAAAPLNNTIIQYTYTPGSPGFFTYGQASPLTPPNTIEIHEMLIHPTLSKIYVQSSEVGVNDWIDQFHIDGTGSAGVATENQSLLGNIGAAAMAMDPDGLYMYVSDCTNTRVKVYQIHQTLGYLNHQADYNTPSGQCPKKIISVKVRQ